eukprot:4732583-Pyramimonas_sp.AAC.1
MICWVRDQAYKATGRSAESRCGARVVDRLSRVKQRASMKGHRLAINKYLGKESDREALLVEPKKELF